MSTTTKEQLQKTDHGMEKSHEQGQEEIQLVAVHRTLTLHCLNNSVLELGPRSGNITWPYTVTLAVIRLTYLSR